MKSPVTIVKEKFGQKSALVAAVEKLGAEDLWVARTNKDKGLAHVSNAKLLRLLATFTVVKEKFGSRDKLIGAILEVEKRTKDEGYKSRLTAFPVPRLYDLYKSASKRSAAQSAPAGAAKKSPAAAKAPKAAAKAPAKADAKAKKPAAKKA